MAEISRPGVRVRQTFRTTSPTFITPEMPACVVGPCNQVVEGVQDDGTFNPDALIVLPARIEFPWLSSPYEYAAIGGDDLELSVNRAAVETVTFPGAGVRTAAQVVDDINELGIAGLVAFVEVRATQQRAVVATTTTGDNASLSVGTGTHADVLAAFGLTLGYTAEGHSGYANALQIRLQPADYPDPRDNLAQLDIDFTTTRVFVNDGAGNVREARRDQAFLDGDASAVSVQDDGDGDNLSPYLNFANALFSDQAAALTGNVDWTTLVTADFTTQSFEVIVDGTPILTTFANPANATAALAALNVALGANAEATLDSNDFLVITSATEGPDSSVLIGNGGTIDETTLGFAVGAYATGKPGRARAQGTEDLTALTYATDVQGKVLRMSIDGQAYQTRTFSTGVTDAATLVASINALWGAGVAEVGEDSTLVLNSLLPDGGRLSSIRIDKVASSASLLTDLGLTGSGDDFETVSAVYGSAYAPAVGDEVWVNGLRLGQITEIVSGVDNRLRIDTEQLLTFTGSSWTIIAKGLDNDLPTVTRPGSELYVDETTGAAVIAPGLFRDSAGRITTAPTQALYLAYTALRLDVTAQGEDFSILSYGSTVDIGTDLAPLDPSNPLGLGMYIAALSAPGVLVQGLGVAETTPSVPDGTLEGYVEAFEFLESKNPYAIVPLSHDVDVGAVGQAHVNAMSDPEISLERYLLFNPLRPSRKSATLVSSSQLGNVAGVPTDLLSTGVANLQALLAAAGKPGPTYTIADGVYVEFEDDTNKYLVESVSGGDLVIADGPFLTGNTDGFYYDVSGGDIFTAVKVDVPVTVKIRGAALSNRDEEAAAYADIAGGFRDRRVVVTAPDKGKMSIDGLETIVEGYYMNCAVAGMRSAQPPQKPLTNEAIVGFTGVIGSHDRYSERQLRILSGGGLWVFQQDSATGPVLVRHQLTSDMSTLEKREDNIRTALDFAAKFLRGILKNFTGRYVLTTQITDAVSTVLSGGGRLLVAQGVFLKFEIGALRPNADRPDRLDVDCVVRAPYPLNDIDITLVV